MQPKKLLLPLIFAAVALLGLFATIAKPMGTYVAGVLVLNTPLSSSGWTSDLADQNAWLKSYWNAPGNGPLSSETMEMRWRSANGPQTYTGVGYNPSTMTINQWIDNYTTGAYINMVLEPPTAQLLRVPRHVPALERAPFEIPEGRFALAAA